MTAQERIEAHLREDAGSFLCASCFAHEVSVQPCEGRNVVRTLQARSGFQVRANQCVSCVRRTPTIRYVGNQTVAAPAKWCRSF